MYATTLRSDLRATLDQIKLPKAPRLLPKKEDKGPNMLWWDSFDEGAEFHCEQEAGQSGRVEDTIEIDFTRVDRLLAADDDAG